MRILIISLHYAPELTGNAPYVASLADGLAARGHEVSVITTHPHYPQWRRHPGYRGWTKTEVSDSGVSIRRLSHYIPRTPSALRRVFAEVSFGLRARVTAWPEADLVIMPSPGLLATRVVRGRALRNGPSVVWLQDIYSLGMNETGQSQGRLAAAMEKLERGTLSSPVKVMAIHRRFADYIATRLGVRPDHLEVIRNWTHLQSAPSLPGRAATRARLGWDEDELVVLHAGNQGVKQGLENVVSAAAVADARSARVRFVLLGHGNQHAALREQAIGVERLQFIEPLPDDEYQAAMSAADVLLVNERPGVAEMSVPSKLTSYFSMGVPVLAATDEGSVTSEEIETSAAGLRVDSADPEGLVDAVERLSARPELRAALAAAGPPYVERVLSMRAALDHAEEFFRACAAREPVIASKLTAVDSVAR